jgi:branched-chain amino acid transport system ATP-binding protein
MLKNPPALALQNVHKSFGATHVIQGVDWVVAAGARVVVIGPNGAGKSTLFNLISGREKPTSGQIFLHGQPIAGKTPFAINRLGLARSFQTTHLFGSLSVFENLRCGALWALGYGYNFWRFLSGLTDVNERAQQLMGQLGLAHQRNTPAQHLTYAEQRALELGVTVIGNAQVILLDEPTAGMSQSETQRFIPLILQLTQGKTLIAVEHDMSVVFGLADQVAVLVNGRLIAFDTPDAVRANPQVQQAYLGVV